jgi:hypothetical protein
MVSKIPAQSQNANNFFFAARPVSMSSVAIPAPEASNHLYSLPREMLSRILDEMQPQRRQGHMRIVFRDGNTVKAWRPLLLLARTCKRAQLDFYPLIYGYDVIEVTLPSGNIIEDVVLQPSFWAWSLMNAKADMQKTKDLIAECVTTGHIEKGNFIIFSLTVTTGNLLGFCESTNRVVTVRDFFGREAIPVITTLVGELRMAVTKISPMMTKAEHGKLPSNCFAFFARLSVHMPAGDITRVFVRWSRSPPNSVRRPPGAIGWHFTVLTGAPKDTKKNIVAKLANSKCYSTAEFVVEFRKRLAAGLTVTPSVAQ